MRLIQVKWGRFELELPVDVVVLLLRAFLLLQDVKY